MQSYDIFGDLLGARAKYWPYDKGHLTMVLEVSVGLFAGLLRALRLVGRDSGGGIRTRDLRVMSPTSYQTAPPRGGPTMVAQKWRSCRRYEHPRRRHSSV